MAQLVSSRQLGDDTVDSRDRRIHGVYHVTPSEGSVTINLHPLNKVDDPATITGQSTAYLENATPKVFPSLLGKTFTNTAYVQDELPEKDIEAFKTEPLSSPDASSYNDSSVTRGLSNDSFQVFQARIKRFRDEHKIQIKRTILAFLFVAYNVYLGFAIHESWKNTCTYCEGVKFLILITGVVYFVIIYYMVLKRFFKKPIRRIFRPGVKLFNRLMRNKWVSRGLLVVVIIAIITFLVIDTENNRMRLVSASGLVVFIGLGFLGSKHRTKIAWRQVCSGIILQIVFGLLIFRWEIGKNLFECIGTKVERFLAFTDHGSGFVFGYLVTGLDLNGDSIPDTAGLFAFKVVPVVIFFSFFVSILYYYGVMQTLVIKIGWLLQKVMGTTACESVNASANIFLGMTEAPLLIQPYVSLMTNSEIHAVLTGGFATIAGSVLAGYISFGISASHLLSASVMSAPAALSYSKLVYPETEVSRTTADNIRIEKGKESNAIHAGVNGVSTAISLCANIVANLIAFLAFIGFADFLISWFASLVGYDFVTFEWLMSKLFMPLAFMMGVKWEECDMVARLVGLKTIVNEFVAYKTLADVKKAKAISPRAEYIATYALCGFSNIGSIGIQIGGIGSLAPDRKPDISRLAVRAMIAGSVACFMTACIAGMLIDAPEKPSEIGGNFTVDEDNITTTIVTTIVNNALTNLANT